MASVLSQFYRNILNVGSAMTQEGTAGNDATRLGWRYSTITTGWTETNYHHRPAAGNSYIEGGKGADTLTGGLRVKIRLAI